jgi:hypothetical protein
MALFCIEEAGRREHPRAGSVEGYDACAVGVHDRQYSKVGQRIAVGSGKLEAAGPAGRRAKTPKEVASTVTSVV